MPYVMRDSEGRIVAVGQTPAAGLDEELSPGDPELAGFLDEVIDNASSLAITDRGFARVVEDLVEVLIEKDVIQFSDLPEDARNKITYRQQLRRQLRITLDLIGEGQ